MSAPRAEGGDHDKIVALPRAQAPPDPPRASRPGRLHGMFIAGMSLAAFVGIVAMFGFITIGWPGDTGRYVIGIFLISVLVFVTCAAAAVLTAARDTYAAREGDHLD